MIGRTKQLHETLVDGIPTFFVETGQTLRATLSFRVGMTDEVLAARGWTHLAEHLAMHDLQQPSVLSNATVGGWVTDFTFAGDAEDVVDRLAQLCRWLREPRLDHLEHERGILLAESARRITGEFGNHARLRFGARGYGLLAYPELGLRQVAEEQMRSLIARSFVAGNAALSLNGPPPPGLILDLPAGDRLPLSQSAPNDTSPPYHAWSWDDLAASSGLCRAAFESTIAQDLLTKRISSKLRDEQGQSYATSGLVDRIDATTLMVLIESDVTDEAMVRVVDVLHREYSQLAADGPRDDEVDVIRRHRLRALDDDLTGDWQATASAHAHLRGEPPRRHQDLRTLLGAMTPESLTPTLAELAESMVVSSPAGRSSGTGLRFESGLPDLPAPGDGRQFRAALAPVDPAVLVVSDDILEIADAVGDVRRISLQDCVALEKYADGGRVIWTGQGDVLQVEPTQWRDGLLAVGEVDRAVDRAVHLHRPARPPEERPAAPRFRMRQRLAVVADHPLGYAIFTFLTIVVLGAAVAVLFGRSNLPGGGSVKGLLLFGLLFAAIMTWLTRGRRKERRPATILSATESPQPHDTASHSTHRADEAAILISRSCTTSWLDWVHGELWIAPDALVRLRLGLGRTIRHGSRPTVALPERLDPDLPEFAPPAVLAGHRTNKYIRFEDIATAKLRQGIMTGRLTVTTYAGVQHKLFWLNADPAFMALVSALPERIPGRLTLDRPLMPRSARADSAND